MKIGEEASAYKIEPSIMDTGPPNRESELGEEETKNRQEFASPTRSTVNVDDFSDIVPAVLTGGISPSQKTLKIPRLSVNVVHE